jgi:DNA-binding CsgD family transcriptional regulator
MAAPGDVDVVDVLYTAAADPPQWPHALTVVADHLGALGGMLVCNADPPELSSCLVGRLCPETTALYLREYTDNPWTRAADSLPVGQVAALGQLYDLREGRHLAWYADILLPTNTQDMAVLALPGFTTDTSVGGIAFCFSESGTPAVEDALRRMTGLVPHITRAVWLSQQVDQSRARGEQLDEMLQSSPRPTLLISSTQRLVGANLAAEMVLREREGLSVDGTARLRATTAADDDALQAAIRRVASPLGEDDHGPLAVRVSRPTKAPLMLLFTPLTGHFALPALDPGSTAVALVTIIDPQGAYDDKIESLVDLLNLTPSEARVAVLLAAGIGRENAAARLHVSVETIKKHTAACFRKIGVSSQVALAHVVSSMPPRG